MKIRRKIKIYIVAALAFCVFCTCAFTACRKKPADKPVNEETEYDPNHGVDLSSAPITIAKNGGSEYTILVSDNANACETFAAEELSAFIEEATGAKLPIAREGSFDGGKYISVGDTVLFSQFNDRYDFSAMNLDGFVLKSDGDDLYIKGARDRGTLYGVYDFLEKFVGIRFITQTYTHVPKTDELSVHRMDVTEIPAFEVRSWWTSDTELDAQFAARLRTGTIWNMSAEQYGYGIYRDFHFDGHNVLNLTDANSNFESHPECFAEINGARKKLDICWSNGVKDDGSFDDSLEISTAKLLAEGLKKTIRGNPGAEYYFIGQEDSTANVCACDRCTKTREKYGSISAAIVRMLNVVGAELQKWSDVEMNGKHIKIAAFAYNYSEMPPVRKDTNGNFSYTDSQVVPSEHVYILITTASNGNHAYSYTDERQREWNFTMFGGWKYLTDNLMVYDYLTNFENYFWYHPNLSTLKDSMLFFDKTGMKTLIYEADKISGNFQAYLKGYIVSRLMWNPNRNVKDLTEEFVSFYFGKYASEISEYISDMETHLAYVKSVYKDEYFAHMSTEGNMFDAKFYPINLLRKEETRLKNVIADIQADSSLSDNEKRELIKRVSSVLITPQIMILVNYPSYYGQVGILEYAKEVFATHETTEISYDLMDRIKESYGL